MKLYSYERAKRMAKKLKSTLERDYGHALKLSACQHVVATAWGCRDWHDMLLRFDHGDAVLEWNLEPAVSWLSGSGRGLEPEVAKVALGTLEAFYDDGAAASEESSTDLDRNWSDEFR